MLSASSAARSRSADASAGTAAVRAPRKLSVNEPLIAPSALVATTCTSATPGAPSHSTRNALTAARSSRGAAHDTLSAPALVGLRRMSRGASGATALAAVDGGVEYTALPHAAPTPFHAATCAW